MGEKPPRRHRSRFVPNAPNIAYVVAAPVAIIAVVVPLTVLAPALGRPVPPLWVLAALGLVLAPMAYWIVRVMLFARRVARSDGFLCLNCHYDLHGLSNRGECPECGEAYDRDELERRWNTWLLSQTKNRKAVQPRFDTGEVGPPRPRLPRARGPTLIYGTFVPLALVPPLAIVSVEAARSGWAPVWAPLAAACVALAGAVANASRVLRFQRRVREADGLLCLRCRRDLRQTQNEAGECPGCGERYWKEGVRGRWREYLISGYLGNP